MTIMHECLGVDWRQQSLAKSGAWMLREDQPTPSMEASLVRVDFFFLFFLSSLLLLVAGVRAILTFFLCKTGSGS